MTQAQVQLQSKSMPLPSAFTQDPLFAGVAQGPPAHGLPSALSSTATSHSGELMAKAYWISFYNEITDTEKMAAYAKLAAPAIVAGGGQFLARGVADQAYEAGHKQRVTLIAFDSIEAAVATHDSAAYQEALRALDGGAIRDIRFVGGLS
jgi:uncharacterized protein (DUF1330 family)